MTTTTEPVKKRFRTLDSACEHIEKLEQQIVVLNASLSSKSAAQAKAQNANRPSAPAPVNQSAQAATPPAAKSLDDYSLSELVAAADEAHARGDTAAANRFYRTYEARKPSRC